MKKHAIIKSDGFAYFSKTNGLIVIKKDVFGYDKLLATLLSDDFDEATFVEQLVKVSTGDLSAVSDGNMKVTEGHVEVKVDDQILVLPIDIQTKVKELRKAGASYSHLENFWRRCLANPNRGSIEQLFNFVSRHLMTITEDGCFIGYKALRSDYWDKYTGNTYHNTPGSVITMNRDDVTFDPEKGCSQGLHVANLEYAQWYASGNDIIVTVLVDPADVVSVAYECTYQKIRVCKYKVIDVYQGSTEIQAPVVSEELVPVLEDRSKEIRTGEWSDVDIRAINAARQLIKSKVMSNADIDAMAVNLASKLNREVAEVIEALYVAPEVNSTVFNKDQLNFIYMLTKRIGHKWLSIKSSLKARYPELGLKVSEDTIRKTAKRMGL